MLRNAMDREYLLSLGATPKQLDQFNEDIRRALNIIEDAKPFQANIAPPREYRDDDQTLSLTGIFLPLQSSFSTSTFLPSRNNTSCSPRYRSTAELVESTCLSADDMKSEISANTQSAHKNGHEMNSPIVRPMETHKIEINNNTTAAETVKLRFIGDEVANRDNVLARNSNRK
jgi:hypothetical protein